MKNDEKSGPKPESRVEDRELSQPELEKVVGGLKAAPTAFDPDKGLLTGESGGMNGVLGGRGGMSGDLGEGVV